MDSPQVPSRAAPGPHPQELAEFGPVHQDDDGMLRATHLRDGSTITAPTPARLEAAACAARICASLRSAWR